MDLSYLLPLFAQTGALGVFAWVLYLFHRSARRADERAVTAHEKRADDAWAAYRAERERCDERDAQIAHIFSAVRTATTNAPPVKEGT